MPQDVAVDAASIELRDGKDLNDSADVALQTNIKERAYSSTWNGTNIVLIDKNDLKALGIHDEIESQEEITDTSVDGAAKGDIDADLYESKESESNADHSNGSNQRTVRRMSSGKHKDYGWLRLLDLRTDIPSMSDILNWDFDVLEFEEAVLIQVFIMLLEYYHLLEKFNLDRATLERYCMAVMQRHNKDCYYQEIDISQGEKEVSLENDSSSERCDGVTRTFKSDTLCEYHNWYHAISCAHASFLFLALGGADSILMPDEIFSVLIGALIHDMEHPGTNNDFEIKRSTELAEIYENDAVLERHSIQQGLKLCYDNSELNWLDSFKNESARENVEGFITECILATDPARHAAIVKEALEFVEKGPLYGHVDPKSEPVLAESSSDSSPIIPDKCHFDREDKNHRLFLGRFILHCADISNPLHSSFEVARDWAVRVTTEFSRQASKEKQLQLPVTSFMDGLDSEYKIAKLQIGFFGFMLQPLYRTLGILLPNTKHLETWGINNCDEYRKVITAYEERNSPP